MLVLVSQDTLFIIYGHKWEKAGLKWHVKGVKVNKIWPLPAEKVTAQEGRQQNLNSCRDRWWKSD